MVFVVIGDVKAGEPRLDDAVDDNVVRACQQGDRAAYAKLVERHYRHVFALCLGMLGNVHDAEDMAQEAMLRGLASIRKLAKRGRFEPWILKIAKNLCLDLLRRQKRLKSGAAGHRVECTGQANENDDLERAMRELPLELRVPLTMYYFEQKNARNIARRLNISHSLACQRIRTARDELYALLTKGSPHER
jgi:RNA polymerase sigma-70 factor (ECF subfamily)